MARATLILLRADIISEQSTYLMWLLWEAGGSDCGTGAGDAASLITTDITAEKRGAQPAGEGEGLGGG